MRLFLVRLLMKLLGGISNMEVSKINRKKMEDWLANLSSDSYGYKDYYTMRKRQLLNALTLYRGDQVYWTTLGRLQELQYMNVLSMQVLKKKPIDTKETTES